MTSRFSCMTPGMERFSLNLLQTVNKWRIYFGSRVCRDFLKHFLSLVNSEKTRFFFLYYNLFDLEQTYTKVKSSPNINDNELMVMIKKLCNE